MNGCDCLDQSVSYYSNLDRKTVKWWKRIFNWLIEVTQANSYILYLLTCPHNSKRITLKKFKENLIEELVNSCITMMPDNSTLLKRVRQVSNPVLERFNNTRHLIKYVESDRNCVVCSTPVNRKRTNFICSGCSNEPHLHPKDCFLIYHSR